MPNPKITGIVHTRDSAATLEAALASLAWVDELMVVDMESSDDSVAIAQRHGAVVHQIEIAPRIDGVRNRFVAKASGDWVLVLDSDEYLSDDAPELVQRLIAKQGQKHDAFALPRYNYLGEQVLLGGGRHPDYQIRLFKQGTVLWPDAHHTLPVVTTGPSRLWDVPPSHGPHIHHRNYRDLRQLISRQLDYALTDMYPDDPGSFDFAAYLARAHQQMAMRSEPEADGDLSQAMALVMAWDAVMRGLIHWDSLEPRPPLNMLDGFPRAAAQVPRWEIRLRRYLGRHLALRHLLKAVLARLRALLPKRG
ncbi:MAG: glycosyltransferase family 2 protein [Desulfarculaceae bacterium]|nr:glycosyltransferase family 2 protein [Desulfarculaceae bacterium]MCF8065781.1 glycosyltransferase family 2 protein [Desulfarculaceae bacterium]MCF8097610.1 glycosyltransferase family 2 protein [Desulfarculaceae bacterium]MCF8122392.1 glycosyltransferase family 2 protein [Desulfarculaceae bacterium]